MLKHLWATDIQWDWDEEEGNPNLPSDVLIPDTMAQEYIDLDPEEEEVADEVSDWLSDVYGFCHKGFNLEWR